MVRKLLVTALAATMIPMSPAIAQHGPGGMHGPPGGMPAGSMGNPGAMGNSGMSGMQGGMNDIGTLTRDQARMNSQGPANASPTGIAHANSNSVLAGTSGGTVLTGVTSGMALMQNGTQVGTVQRVVTNGQGVITRVLVTGTNGRTFSLSPSSLSLTGGVLTTTATLRM
jgi:hypothetical protein